jgi:hypothetical protein
MGGGGGGGGGTSCVAGAITISQQSRLLHLKAMPACTMQRELVRSHAGRGRGVSHAPRRYTYLRTSWASLFDGLADEQRLFATRDLAAKCQRPLRVEVEARSWTMILIISIGVSDSFLGRLPGAKP